MNKKFYVFLILIALIILPSLIRGAQEAPIPAASLVLDVSESWLPTKNNHIIVTVTLPSRAVHPGSQVTFSLLSSSWPGYCMNAYFGDDFDSDDKNTAEDMSFIPSNQSEIIGCTWIPARTSSEPVQDIILQFGNNAENLPGSVALRIESYDYGAIAKLHVAISYNDEIQVQNSAMIPVDDDCNYISDYWQLNEWGVPTLGPYPPGEPPGRIAWTGTATDDLESGPGANMHLGDGITAVEEWRGFIISGGHTRTHVRKKDIFILPDTQLSTYGYGWTDQLDNIFTRHTVTENEVWDFQSNKDYRVKKNTSLNFLIC